MSGCAALPMEPHVGLNRRVQAPSRRPHECARMYRTETDNFPKKVQDCPFTDRLAMLGFCLTGLGADVLAAAEGWPSRGAQEPVSR